MTQLGMRKTIRNDLAFVKNLVLTKVYRRKCYIRTSRAIIDINKQWSSGVTVEPRRDSSEILNFRELSLDDSYKLNSYIKKCVSISSTH